MDQQYIEQIESRLQIISSRLNQLNDKKHLLEDNEKLNRISELYSMVAKWKDTSSMVPILVERLAALNEIHQRAFEFPSIVSRLDVEQQEIKQRLETSADVLIKVLNVLINLLINKILNIFNFKLKKNLDDNLESIKNNFAALNERMQLLNGEKN